MINKEFRLEKARGASRGLFFGTISRMKDARVASAISHWAPRLVSNRVILADFEEGTGSIERWEDWCAAWSARAKLHEDLGAEALRDRHRLTAGEHFVRGGVDFQ